MAGDMCDVFNLGGPKGTTIKDTLGWSLGISINCISWWMMQLFECDQSRPYALKQEHTSVPWVKWATTD